ncbi:MAG: GDP-L-fucose synthase, partial [Pseudomonadales bacterium]|nr:GDP-L-fucose synthase [Pseudomonadales bacterium]
MNLNQARYQANTHPMMSHLNVGTGIDCTIRELAETMKDVVGFEGRIIFDANKPDGTPRKLLDVTRLAELGWRSTISLREGLVTTYEWFKENAASYRT